MDKKAVASVTDRQKFEARVEHQVDRMFDKLFDRAQNAWNKDVKGTRTEFSYDVMPTLWTMFSSDKFKKAYMDRMVRKYDRHNTATWRVSFSRGVNATGYGPLKIVFSKKES
jgi:hypothetical protein